MHNSHMDPAIEAARRASERSAVLVRANMNQRVDSLAIVASTAPLVGLLGTIPMLIGSFPGGSWEKEAWFFQTMIWLSDALTPTALGLLVGLIAHLLYRYFLNELDALDLDMAYATAGLTSALACGGDSLTWADAAPRDFPPMFGAEPLEQGERDECLRQFERDEQLRHSLILVTRVALASALLFHSTSSFFVDLLNPVSAIVSSFFRVAFHLAVCGSLVYPIWVLFLKRRPGVFVALSSALACCWAIVDFSLSWHHWLTDF